MIACAVVTVRLGILRNLNRHVASLKAERFFHASVAWRSSMYARVLATILYVIVA
jgi:hypothetical protein